MARRDEDGQPGRGHKKGQGSGTANSAAARSGGTRGRFRPVAGGSKTRQGNASEALKKPKGGDAK